ncbi:MAG TPA: methylated-DNA--[protein]-cysteine S-methyltransferase [Longimicrobium sp.]|nr:methylated-DNA--[protein]-cysteine S-methyltransferase [Longimicrobium sp.]
MSLFATRIDTPIGALVALVDEDGALARLLFPHEPVPQAVVWDDARGAPAAAQLGEYFRGERQSFDLALAPRGTDFQRAVWRELQRIPYGATVSYRALAERVGRPKASRAVGRANATNPLPIVVPCHRVIGADGTPTGYAGGISAKTTLLALENRST